MNWFRKKVSEKKIEEVINGILVEYVDPSVMAKKSEDEIREPVHSFLKTFKENRRRFVILSYEKPYSTKYTLVDNITKERFDLTSGMLVFAGSIRSLTSSEEWLKYEELQYIYSEIRAFDGRRGARYQELLKIRKKRVEEKERKRLTEVYK